MEGIIMFFKNREMRIKVVKNDEKKIHEIPMKEDRLPAYADAAKKIVITGALVVYGYVVMDTFRQTQVAKVVYQDRER